MYDCCPRKPTYMYFCCLQDGTVNQFSWGSEELLRTSVKWFVFFSTHTCFHCISRNFITCMYIFFVLPLSFLLKCRLSFCSVEIGHANFLVRNAVQSLFLSPFFVLHNLPVQILSQPVVPVLLLSGFVRRGREGFGAADRRDTMDVECGYPAAAIRRVVVVTG